MTGVRQEVQHFMRECERFFGFASQNGGLTAEECEALQYYANELNTHVTKFCGVADHRECES